MDPAGGQYIAGSGNHRILKFAPNGAVTTVSSQDYPFGRGGEFHRQAFIADTFSMVAAGVYEPTGTAVDARGNLYIADKVNRRVLRNGFIVADQVDPAGIAADQDGYLYIADSAINRIRNAASNGTISTVVAKGIGCLSSRRRKTNGESSSWRTSIINWSAKPGTHENPRNPLRGHRGASGSPGLYNAVSIQLLIGDLGRIHGDRAARLHRADPDRGL